jgi:hypothetical protein
VAPTTPTELPSDEQLVWMALADAFADHPECFVYTTDPLEALKS